MTKIINRQLNKALCIAVVVAAMQVLFSCSDDTTPAYSRNEPVQCHFMVLQYKELFGVIDNFGQFATIRQSGANLIMQSSTGQTTYNMDATQKYFKFGLGGLIVGTTYEGEYRVYDYACPNCNRVDRRLNLSDNGFATCPGKNCHIEYNLTNGAVNRVPAECTHDKPRGLYRYRITYDGQYIHIYN